MDRNIIVRKDSWIRDLLNYYALANERYSKEEDSCIGDDV